VRQGVALLLVAAVLCSAPGGVTAQLGGNCASNSYSASTTAPVVTVAVRGAHAQRGARGSRVAYASVLL
jgi:hypothetical protein